MLGYTEKIIGRGIFHVDTTVHDSTTPFLHYFEKMTNRGKPLVRHCPTNSKKFQKFHKKFDFLYKQFHRTVSQIPKSGFPLA